MVAVTEASCPKCGAPRRNEAACPKCGLRGTNMAVYERTREASVPASVRAAWEAVTASWDDPAAHDALFTLTAQHQAYAWTAARYREARAGKPAGSIDPHLERMRKAVEATLLVTATHREKRKQPYLSSIIVLGLVGFMIVVGMMLATYFQGRARGPEKSSGSPPAASSQVR